MTMGEIIRQGFHYARTCRSLWVFGFFVGMASSGGGSGGGGGAGGDGGGSLSLPVPAIVLIALVVLLVVAAAFVMRFVSEGALIEGVARVRQGGTVTTRDGFRAGWAHWGVLVRIALLYLAANFGSLALLAAPSVIALRAVGPFGGVLLGVPALLIAVPWLVTLYLVQAFASRIAVLENRHALDAIGKARIFLHGRLMHGLKLIVATFIGTLMTIVVGIVVTVPVVLLLVALLPAGPVPVVVFGAILLLPAVYVLAAVVGTYRSSIWTVGYLMQVES